LRLDAPAVMKLLSTPRFSFQAPTFETLRNLLWSWAQFSGGLGGRVPSIF